MGGVQIVLVSLAFAAAPPSWEPALPLPEALSGVMLLPMANGTVLALGEGVDGLEGYVYQRSPPGWTAVPPLGGLHAGWRAVLLHDGRVLVAGGVSAGGTELAATHFLSATTLEWSAGSPLPEGLSEFTLNVLADGSVLVAGGVSGGFRVASTYLLDPLGGGWQPGADLREARAVHSSVLLTDGSVLVAGGQQGNSQFALAAEVFDSVSAGWTSTGNLSAPRETGSLIALPERGALYTGGDALTPFLDNADLFEGLARLSDASMRLQEGRREHGTILLPDGRPWILGGYERDSMEVFDPASRTFSLAGVLPSRRGGSGITLLGDGRFMLAGGYNVSQGALSSTLMTALSADAYVRPTCRGAYAGARVAWTGSGLAAPSGPLLAAPFPPNPTGIALMAVAGGALWYPSWTQSSPGIGELTLPPELPAGWYHLHAVVDGAYGGGELLRVGRAPGQPCQADHHCGSGLCEGGLCTEGDCPDAVQRRPLSLVVGCSCGAPISGSGAVLALLLTLGRRRRWLG